VQRFTVTRAEEENAMSETMWNEMENVIGSSSLTDEEIALIQADSPADSAWSSYGGSTTSKKCCE
jgi:hypothetical protein